MDFRAPQAFIGIDVANSAHHGLVEQDSLDARFARLNPRAKFGCCDFQRLEAQAAEDAFVRAIREQRHASESANIVVTKLAAIIESEEYVGVQLDGRLRRADADFAGHAEVNQQRTFFGGSFSRLKVQHQIFSQAPDARKPAARQILFQRRGIVNEIRLAQTHAQNPAAGENLTQSTRYS